MKHAIMLVVLALAMSGCSQCGHTAVGNDANGQVKKVSHETPLVCPAYTAADLSLGIMRNGVGSMSTQDQWYEVPSQEILKSLEEAANSGRLVRVTYDVWRVALCRPDHVITAVQIID